MSPRPLLLALALALVTPPLAARDAAADEGEKRHGEAVERVVAVVNNEVILLSEVRDRAQQLGQVIDENGPPEVKAASQKLLRQVLDQMIDEALVLQQAKDLKLTVEEAEIDRAIEEVKKSNNLDTDAFVRELAAQGFSLAAFRKDMRKQILRMKTINQTVRSRLSFSDEDVRAYYEQNARQSGGHREAHVRHVLIAAPAGEGKAVEAKRQLAARIVEDARGGADFGKLAKNVSDDAATRDDGGDLGWIKEGEGLDPALSEVVFSMDKPGEVRGPVRTARGFEVVTLIDRRDGDVRPFEEVKDQIRAQLSQQQVKKQEQTWIQELRKKAHIEVRL